MESIKDLSNKNFIGRVIFNEDPDFSGRCKVKVFGLMDELDNMFVPWFAPMTSSVFSSNTGGGSMSVPKLGTLVRVRFANDDIYSGEYTNIQNVDPYLAEEIKTDYVGTHVICYDADEELMILFQPHYGLRLYYKESYFSIAPDNMITLSTPNNESIIQMVGDEMRLTTKGSINITSTDVVNVDSGVVNINSKTTNIGKGDLVPAVNGDELLKVLKSLATQISAKYPVTPGTPNPMSFGSILSNSVKISK